MRPALNGQGGVCVAKTQKLFSTDPSLRGAPAGNSLTIREVRLAADAEFIVIVGGDIRTMSGLPRVPSSERIDLLTARSWACSDGSPLLMGVPWA